MKQYLLVALFITITLLGVNSEETQCGIDVDGQAQWVEEGTTGVFDSVKIHVFDAIAHHDEERSSTCRVIIYRI